MFTVGELVFTSYLNNNIVTIEFNGEFNATDFCEEQKKWCEGHRDEFVGFIFDINNMTKHPALEQRKAEAYSKKLQIQKPRAVVGKGGMEERICNIYIRFTKAENMKFFHTNGEAEEWLHSLN